MCCFSWLPLSQLRKAGGEAFRKENSKKKSREKGNTYRKGLSMSMRKNKFLVHVPALLSLGLGNSPSRMFIKEEKFARARNVRTFPRSKAWKQFSSHYQAAPWSQKSKNHPQKNRRVRKQSQEPKSHPLQKERLPGSRSKRKCRSFERVKVIDIRASA